MKYNALLPMQYYGVIRLVHDIWTNDATVGYEFGFIPWWKVANVRPHPLSFGIVR
jgi:hypothetical protein